MLATIWTWVKTNLLSTMMGVLVLVYIVAWASNALVGTKFDLPQLLSLFQYVLGKIGLDSVFNTAFGSTKPKENINA